MRREQTPDSVFGGSVGFLLLVTALILISCSQPGSTDERLLELGGEPCSPESEFQCVDLDVPLNHFDSADKRSIEPVFAVRAASGPTEGVLVVAVGGPGASGVSEADRQLSSFDPSILETFDLVFFDQRGVGLFEEPVCPRTDQASGNEEVSEDWEIFVAKSGEYFGHCTVESGQAGILSHLGTDQAIHDLEHFRQAMGYGALTLYGRSYGTRFVQTYATAFPHSVRRMVLDGPVDTASNVLQDTKDQIAALENIVDEMLSACDIDARCAGDMGVSAEVAYNSLLTELAGSPAKVDYPVEPDVWQEYQLTDEDVSRLAFEAAYSDHTRMVFLRALAAATRDSDLIPMMRLFSYGEGDGISTVLNLAVNCQDISIPGDDTTSEIEAITEAGLTVEPEHRWHYRFPAVCISWPGVDPTQTSAEPFEGAGIPTLVVAADLDPVTPHSQAESVIRHLEEGHLLTVRGGSHVMYGNGSACVDEAVTAFLLDGILPPTACEMDVIVPYVPLLPEDPTHWSTAELLSIVDDELYYSPDLTLVDDSGWVSIACDEGGAITFQATDVGAIFELDHCGFTDQITISGNGSWDSIEGVSTYEVSVHGEECEFFYQLRWDDGNEVIRPTCP